MTKVVDMKGNEREAGLDRLVVALAKEAARRDYDEIEVIRHGAHSIIPTGLYTRDQTAHYFQVSKRTLARWEAEGRGPKVTRIGLAVYYKGSSILAALEEGTAE